MALDTYTGLQTSIASWMDRTDLTSVIPDFITLFEVTANQELPLRTRYNLTSTTLTTVANTATVSLPSDFNEAVTLVNSGSSTPNTPLSSYPISSIYTNYPQTTTGQPVAFSTEGSSLLLRPTPDAAYPLTLYYYQKVSPLSSTNTSNWLLANFPNLYLFGALTSAEAYLGADPRIKLWGDLYDNMIQKLTGSTERGKYGGSPLSVRVDTIA